MKIAVFGGTGFIGAPLVRSLRQRQHEVVVLDLRKDPAWESALRDVDAVINLAGTPLFGKRWTTDYQAEIYDSRIEGTTKLVEALGKIQKSRGESGGKLTLVNASAIGFYGTSLDQTFDEASPAGTDFLAFVCRDWESAALIAERRYGVRTCVIRTGVVLGHGGGALAQLKTPFNFFVGGPIGLGKEWMSWIHLADVVDLYVHLVEHESCRGIYNGTAPNPVRNKEFSRALGDSLGRPSWLPVPGLALRVLVGEAALIIINGQRVVPKRTLAVGFPFRHPQVGDALASIALDGERAKKNPGADKSAVA